MDQREREIDQVFKLDYNSLTPFVMFTAFLFSQGADWKVTKAAAMALVFGVITMMVRYAFARHSLKPRDAVDR